MPTKQNFQLVIIMWLHILKDGAVFYPNFCIEMGIWKAVVDALDVKGLSNRCILLPLSNTSEPCSPPASLVTGFEDHSLPSIFLPLI